MDVGCLPQEYFEEGLFSNMQEIFTFKDKLQISALCFAY